MKIKEILPFTIDTPVIHLVQPSPSIPLGHEVVFQQSSSNGGGVNAIYALAAQEKRVRRHRKFQQEREKEFVEKKESNLNCGFISPPIHPTVEDKKKIKTSFYDLRNNRSMSIAVDTLPKLSPTLSARSKSLDDTPKRERRKKSPDFEDILRELGCSSRTSDAGESTTSKASSGESESGIKQDVTRKCSVASSDSVFYDVSLDDPEIEKSNTSPQVDVTPRKSFSEETFDRNHTNMYKNRSRILETMKKNWRTVSSDSCDESYEEAWNNLKAHDKRRVSQMVDDLLLEIYGDKSTRPVRRRSITGITRGRSPAVEDSHYDSLYEDNTCCTEYTSGSEEFRLAYLQQKSELFDVYVILAAKLRNGVKTQSKTIVNKRLTISS